MSQISCRITCAVAADSNIYKGAPVTEQRLLALPYSDCAGAGLRSHPEKGFVPAYAWGKTASIAGNNIDHEGAIPRLVFKPRN